MTKNYDPLRSARHKRHSTRLPNHNYGWTGTYFITIRSVFEEPLFDIPELRRILQEKWEALPKRYPGLTLDEFVIMPDHIHFIVHLEGNVEKPATLGQVVGAYKSEVIVTWVHYLEAANLHYPGSFWQRNYHDIIIRDGKALQQIRQYIRDNPVELQKQLELQKKRK